MACAGRCQSSASQASAGSLAFKTSTGTESPFILGDFGSLVRNMLGVLLPTKNASVRLRTMAWGSPLHMVKQLVLLLCPAGAMLARTS
jgi:hypothetical protein